MATPVNTSVNPYKLLQAAEAIGNWRALALTAIVLVSTFLCGALTAWAGAGSPIVAIPFGLLTILVGLVGHSSVGILLMRHNQGVQIGLADALTQALFCVHRLFGVGILLLLIFLGVALGGLLLFFLCKIPGIGPLLFAFVLPLVAIAFGVTFAAIYICFPFGAVAVWEGNTVLQAVAKLMGIVRHRLLFSIANLLILSLFIGFISMIIFFILFSGYTTAAGLSAAVGINPIGNVGDLMGQFIPGVGGMYGIGGASSYTGSFSFATGLLFALGFIAPFLATVNGICLVYLQAVDGLDVGEAEAALRRNIDEAKRRAQEAHERAKAKMEEAKAAAQPGIQPAQIVQSTQAVASCSNCNAPLAADDLFCSECGTRRPA